MAVELRTEAVVLRYSPYGEADLIVSLFSPELGVFKGFARSARNSRKRFAAAFEPFSQALFRCRQGRGELLGLLDADLLQARQGLRNDLKTLSCASYAVELVELLLAEGESQPEVFALLTACLDYLEQGGDVAIARLLFELRLIALLGYLPHLLHCSSCQKVFENEEVRFDSARGGSLCRACAAGGGINVGLGTLGSLARILKVPYPVFDGFRFGRKTLDDSASILSQVLQQHLPREPKTMKFMRQIGV
jgi:DNA repair protein RecO (recombination protein O)